MTEAEGQSIWEQQHLDKIAQLTVELEERDENLQYAFKEADEERIPYLQDNQQLQRFVFSNFLSLQGDKNGSLSATGTQLFFKQQKGLPQHIPVSNWIEILILKSLSSSLIS